MARMRRAPRSALDLDPFDRRDVPLVPGIALLRSQLLAALFDRLPVPDDARHVLASRRRPLRISRGRRPRSGGS
jgi:hypothetical protein